ncbi:sortase domain-containing protein [Saccharopolyspora mangrovi]|uniref:Sortase n=1 Tax=Saccharopolyspora mangrovi TaxID=3082379 RepID=A0ABU6AGL5_9PSEU|nr:sortase [Saccharopolyspora sp. S2-29]MEB3370699.1 sortase [Saccharopolyspora sp. S2-29]
MRHSVPRPGGLHARPGRRNGSISTYHVNVITALIEHPSQSRDRRGTSAHGTGFAQLHLPTFGPDFDFTVLEGTDLETLAGGPGHYTGTAWPGEQGNFAVAGHRIGRGAPFNDLDALPSCAPIVVETATHWYVYRVLPMADEVATWDGHGGDPRCQGVAPIPAPTTRSWAGASCSPRRARRSSRCPACRRRRSRATS